MPHTVFGHDACVDALGRAGDLLGKMFVNVFRGNT
jgi:hypothetical protein